MGHANFHTHTYHCQHATGTPSDYAREALKQGISVLGFSDHTPWPDNIWNDVKIRMPLEELDDYFDEIRQAQKEFPQLTIHRGLECEYRPDLGSFAKEVFLDTPGRCEYLILGVHDFLNVQGEWLSPWHSKDSKAYLDFARFTVKALETGLYRFLAHPDLFLVGQGPWNADAEEASRIIIQAAVDTNTPLEFNALGVRKRIRPDAAGVLRRPYTSTRFWEIAAQYPVRGIVSSDAHRPEDVWGNGDQLVGMADYFGIPLVTPEELLPPAPNTP